METRRQVEWLGGEHDIESREVVVAHRLLHLLGCTVLLGSERLEYFSLQAGSKLFDLVVLSLQCAFQSSVVLSRFYLHNFDPAICFLLLFSLKSLHKLYLSFILRSFFSLLLN